MIASSYWEAHGNHFTLTILDKGDFIGGATMMIHGNVAVGGLIYRKPEYDWHGLGIRLLDASTSFIGESGYSAFDLGSAVEYKRKWALELNELLLFKIYPEPLYQAKQIIHWIRKSWSRLSH